MPHIFAQLANLSLTFAQGLVLLSPKPVIGLVCHLSIMTTVYLASNGEQAITRVGRQLQQHAGIVGQRSRPTLQSASLLRYRAKIGLD